MVIKQSTIFKAVMIVVTMYMLGYLDLAVPTEKSSLYRIVFGFLAVLMALITLSASGRDEEFKRRAKFLNQFMIFYVPIILLTAVLSSIWYKYKFMAILPVSAPYFYPLYAYPLIYIFTKDHSHDRFLKTIVTLVVLIMLIKTFAWYMYNYQGVAFFPTILFQHEEGWVRNGVLRVDTGALFGLAVCYSLSAFFVRKSRIAGLIAVGLTLYAVFITQYRFLEIVIIFAGLFIYLTSTDSSKRKLIRILLLVSAVVIFIAVGGLDAIMASFSVENKDYGGSTAARFETLEYFWNSLNVGRVFFGYGFLSTYSTAAIAVMTRSATESYWLEDLGILGGMFMFGLMSFLIYGPLFYRSVKESIKAIREKNPDRALLTGIVGYMIIGCLMLNIFDKQRIFETGVFIATISFIVAPKKQPESPLLEEKMIESQ